MKLDFLREYDFFTGVPDSQLKPLCDYLMDTYGISNQHLIAANEGNCAALAAGYHLATGKTPVVYLQNSGIGNIINPVASLMNEKVYGIPCIFIVGWRGEPGVHDEPQHIFQGEVTVRLLEDMGIATCVLGKESTDEDAAAQMEAWKPMLAEGKQVAFVVKKGALSFPKKVTYRNDYPLLREEIIRQVTQVTEEDLIVSTTGKASRELFEIREEANKGHGLDFLTVGSMGHASSIALGVAIQKPEQKIWILDGDGAALMHLGAMAVLGSNKPANIVHIIINNEAHETVGGMPTVGGSVNFVKIAEGCGYPYVVCVKNATELDSELREAKMRNELTLIEVQCSIGARENLGRPTTTAKENKELFMKQLVK